MSPIGGRKLLKLISNLGYGSRKEVAALFDSGRISAAGRALSQEDEADPAEVRVDGEPLDPLPGVMLMLHKPVGYACSTREHGRASAGSIGTRADCCS
jgi:16S rRNA pseudouridine516 synthase